jgi:hypothetical protein
VCFGQKTSPIFPTTSFQHREAWLPSPLASYFSIHCKMSSLFESLYLNRCPSVIHDSRTYFLISEGFCRFMTSDFVPCPTQSWFNLLRINTKSDNQHNIIWCLVSSTWTQTIAPAFLCLYACLSPEMIVTKTCMVAPPSARFPKGGLAKLPKVWKCKFYK